MAGLIDYKVKLIENACDQEMIIEKNESLSFVWKIPTTKKLLGSID